MKDTYWHIQMHLPGGKDGENTDSSLMLKENPPVIGTSEWDDLQCEHFKGQKGGLTIGDIIMVREGIHPIALCEITSDFFEDANLTKKFVNNWFRKVKVLDWASESEKNKLFTQGTLKPLYKSKNTRSWNYINNWYMQITNKQIIDKQMKDCIDLLRYKKQIILQGPPGTGKTRLAKLIAKQLIIDSIHIRNIDIPSLLQIGDQVQRTSSSTIYTIKEIKANSVIVSTTGEDREPTYKQIYESLEGEFWKSKNRNSNTEIYADAVAKHIFDIFLDSIYAKKYFKLIQFHPSYTYEDFVRGITAKPSETGNGIVYETENKILAEFAEKASDNWDNSKKTTSNTANSTNNANFKNYVLIIDEINRANLSAVLGELIYALEYRGESVDSMYAINSSKKLILPPNLYIIGTMNTADRSVGHIDYAIRRRFAFVDVLPKDLHDELGNRFNSDLFERVSKLFVKNINTLEPADTLSEEFAPKDVWLGHSYFIDKTDEGASMQMRLDYEIKPILREYIKDGVLVGEKISETIENIQLP